jgi:hypothetical protein
MEHLKPAYVLEECERGINDIVETRGDFWIEYYRPLLFTSLGKHFAYSMNSTLKLPGKTAKDINHSPFLAHSTRAVHHPRLMEGVRRWMGTHPTSSPQKIHGKPVSRADVTKVLAEPELNPHSTEAIARQLLNPVVSEEEEEEYQGYVDQCQELIEAAVDRKDRTVYQTVARTATGETADWQDDVADEVFLNYVERGTTQYLDGAGRKDALPVAFNYERWIGGLGQRVL